jgi:hypothetical protein
MVFSHRGGRPLDTLSIMVNPRRRAFINPELLIVTALLAVAMCIVFPVTKHFRWHPLLATTAIFGVYGLIILFMNFENIKADFSARKRKKK